MNYKNLTHVNLKLSHHICHHTKIIKDTYHMTWGVLFSYVFFPNVFAFHFAGPLHESHHENDHPEENVAEETETRMVHKGTDAEHFGMDCVDFSVVFSFDIRLCYVKIYPTKYSECLPTLLALMYMSSRAV